MLHSRLELSTWHRARRTRCAATQRNSEMVHGKGPEASQDGKPRKKHLTPFLCQPTTEYKAKSQSQESLDNVPKHWHRLNPSWEFANPTLPRWHRAANINLAQSRWMNLLFLPQLVQLSQDGTTYCDRLGWNERVNPETSMTNSSRQLLRLFSTKPPQNSNAPRRPVSESCVNIDQFMTPLVNATHKHALPQLAVTCLLCSCEAYKENRKVTTRGKNKQPQTKKTFTAPRISHKDQVECIHRPRTTENKHLTCILYAMPPCHVRSIVSRQQTYHLVLPEDEVSQPPRPSSAASTAISSAANPTERCTTARRSTGSLRDAGNLSWGRPR